MLLSLVSCYYLTKVSWDHYKHELEITNTVPEDIDREENALEAAQSGKPPVSSSKPATDVPLVDADNAGVKTIIEKAKCMTCHGTDLKGQAAAKIPSLHGVGDLLTKEELTATVTNGKGGMPSFKDVLSAQEIDTLTTWLSNQKAPK